MSTLTASQLIEFIPLRDDETGHYFGRYDVRQNVVILAYRGGERRFRLRELQEKAAKFATRHNQSVVIP
jgi:hypothetical protein